MPLENEYAGASSHWHAPAAAKKECSLATLFCESEAFQSHKGKECYASKKMPA